MVPASYGWILLIAGSLVASVTAFFTLFGTGPDERLRPKTEVPKKKGRLPFEVESTTVQEPPPPPPKPVEPPKPKPAPVITSYSIHYTKLYESRALNHFKNIAQDPLRSQ